MAVEQSHAHERPDIGEGVGINMSRLPVPKHGERIEVKHDLTAVGRVPGERDQDRDGLAAVTPLAAKSD